MCKVHMQTNSPVRISLFQHKAQLQRKEVCEGETTSCLTERVLCRGKGSPY